MFISFSFLSSNSGEQTSSKLLSNHHFHHHLNRQIINKSKGICSSYIDVFFNPFSLIIIIKKDSHPNNLFEYYITKLEKGVLR